MQIQSDYNSYSSTGYEHKHNHHITKCLHEDQQEQHKVAAAGVRKDTFAAENGQEGAKQEIIYTHGNMQRAASGVKKGMGFIKGIWDSMGDEGNDESKGVLSQGSSHSGMKGIEAVTSAIKQIFPYRIINKWESVREKLKVSISSTLKRFGKGGDTFDTLTDPKGQFAGKREAGKELGESREKGTRRKEGPVPAAYLSDSHLMDSYSKTGAYCRLNENLTYQKNPSGSKSESKSVKGE